MLCLENDAASPWGVVDTVDDRDNGLDDIWDFALVNGELETFTALVIFAVVVDIVVLILFAAVVVAEMKATYHYCMYTWHTGMFI